MATYAQDSLTVFFIGNIKGERYEVFWDGTLLLKFKGSPSYKYSFKIPIDESWKEKGYIDKISIYRKGNFGLSYKEIGFTVGYEPKKYLVMWRHPNMKNRSAVTYRWEDKEPLRPPSH
jgi:hypothetical protein